MPRAQGCAGAACVRFARSFKYPILKNSHHPSAALRIIPPETHREPIHGDSIANFLLATVSGGTIRIPAWVMWILLEARFH